MCIKATIVAYAFSFSVQYFENATIVAYAGLRVNCPNSCGDLKIIFLSLP